MHNKKLVSILSLSWLGGFLYASSLWNPIMDHTKSFFTLLLIICRDNLKDYLNLISNLSFKVSFIKLGILLKNNISLILNYKMNFYDIMICLGVLFILGAFLFLVYKISQTINLQEGNDSFFSLFEFKYPILSNAEIKNNKVKLNFVEDEFLRNNPDITLFKDYNSLIGRIHQGPIPVALEGDEKDKYYHENESEDESFKIFICNAFKDPGQFISD